jgi:putative serine protease PepD
MDALLEKATVFVLVVKASGRRAGFGTGFVAADGRVVTSGCLVRKAGKSGRILILNEAIPLTEARTLSAACRPGEAADLALISFAPPKGDAVEPLTFARDEGAYYWVAAWGYQAGVLELDESYACVRTADLRCLKAPPIAATSGEVIRAANGAIHHSAPLDEGNQGGPLVNVNGLVVGVNLRKSSGRGSKNSLPLGAALPSGKVVDFLKENGVDPKLDPKSFGDPPPGGKGPRT